MKKENMNRKESMNKLEHKNYNLKLVPGLKGWERLVSKHRQGGRRKVFYTAPCGRRIRSLEEVHGYYYYGGRAATTTEEGTATTTTAATTTTTTAAGAATTTTTAAGAATTTTTTEAEISA